MSRPSILKKPRSDDGEEKELSKLEKRIKKVKFRGIDIPLVKSERRKKMSRSSSGSSFPYSKVVLESAFLFGKVEMNGRTVYINRIWTKNMEESLAPSICNCQLQEVQGYLEDIRRIRVDRTVQSSYPRGILTTVVEAWESVVNNDFRDTEYKGIWSALFWNSAGLACSDRHSLLGLTPSHISGSGAVNVVVEGCPIPVTPANSTDSCDSTDQQMPHTVNTIRMTGLPDFCVTDQRNQKCLVDIENKKAGGGLNQLLYCLLGHALQQKSDMFGIYCDRDSFQPWLVRWEEEKLSFYHSQDKYEGLEGLLKCNLYMWKYISSQTAADNQQ